MNLRMNERTRSVAAGIGQHGIPPPASNDTGRPTTFCFPNQDEAEMRHTDDVSL